jgi:hypothetical protein
MLNYSKIARALIPVQSMPPGALPYFPSARRTPVQQLYHYFLKETGWIVEAAIWDKNQVNIVLCHTHTGRMVEVLLEPPHA